MRSRDRLRNASGCRGKGGFGGERPVHLAMLVRHGGDDGQKDNDIVMVDGEIGNEERLDCALVSKAVNCNSQGNK